MSNPAARWAARAVHLLTASGVVWGFLALVAVADRRWHDALVWMAVAMLVDSVDGWLARAARVKDATPAFDGTLLDNTVDYLNYVVVPAFFMFRAEMLPPALRLPVIAAVLLSSAYQFCQVDAKTADHFFKGFPSFWNVAALYLWFAGLGDGVNAAVLLVLAVGVFVPLKWIYPSRMQRWRAPTLALTALWGLSVAAILFADPQPPRWLLWSSVAYVPVYAGVSLWLSAHAEPGTTSGA